MMNRNRPVLIVGAGPTGMTAAMELNRFGIPVRLVDRYKAPASTSRALAVQSRTMELFSQRGLSEEMLRLGNKGFFTTIYGGGKALGKVDLRHVESRFNFILLLAQSETERILRERLEQQGVTVERETELIAFSQDEERDEGSGVRGILRKAGGVLEEVNAAYVIDAEGAHSSIRHTLGLAFHGKSLQHTYALADLHIDGAVPEDQLSIFVSESGLLAAFPMGDKRYRIIATEKQIPESGASDPDLDRMHRLWNQGSHIRAQFRDMVWSSHFRINSRMLDHLRYQKVFFGGDSAHVHSPAGGQGMNTGIQDMINLGWKMALVYKGIAKPALLDTYETERLPIIKALVSTTEQATDIFDTDSASTRTLLEYALPVALSFRAVRDKGAGIVSETQGNYRSSSLSLRGTCSGTLRAGDRVPDLEVGGTSTGDTFISLLDPSSFTVFLLEGGSKVGDLPNDWEVKRISAPPEGAEGAAAYRKLVGDARQIVVRPDGYVLSISTHGDDRSLAEWRSDWLN